MRGVRTRFEQIRFTGFLFVTDDITPGVEAIQSITPGVEAIQSSCVKLCVQIPQMPNALCENTYIPRKKAQ